MFNSNVLKLLSISLLMCPLFSSAMEPRSDVAEAMLLSIANQSEQIIDTSVLMQDALSKNAAITVQPYEDMDRVISKNDTACITTQLGFFTLAPDNLDHPEFLVLSQHTVGHENQTLIVQEIPYYRSNNITMIVNPDGSVSLAQVDTRYALEKMNIMQQEAQRKLQQEPKHHFGFHNPFGHKKEKKDKRKKSVDINSVHPEEQLEVADGQFQNFLETNCLLCFEQPEGMINIPCTNHHPSEYICLECLDQISKKKNECPICREPLKYEDVTINQSSISEEGIPSSILAAEALGVNPQVAQPTGQNKESNTMTMRAARIDRCLNRIGSIKEEPIALPSAGRPINNVNLNLNIEPHMIQHAPTNNRILTHQINRNNRNNVINQRQPIVQSKKIHNVQRRPREIIVEQPVSQNIVIRDTVEPKIMSGNKGQAQAGKPLVPNQPKAYIVSSKTIPFKSITHTLVDIRFDRQPSNAYFGQFIKYLSGLRAKHLFRINLSDIKTKEIQIQARMSESAVQTLIGMTNGHLSKLQSRNWLD